MGVDSSVKKCLLIYKVLVIDLRKEAFVSSWRVSLIFPIEPLFFAINR